MYRQLATCAWAKGNLLRSGLHPTSLSCGGAGASVIGGVASSTSLQNAFKYNHPGSLVRHCSGVQSATYDSMPKLISMPNGDKVKPTFSQDEMSRRIDMVRGYMAENDIGGVLFTSMHNVNYFSDFLYCAFGRPYGLVVTQDKVTSISAGIDAGQPWRRTSTGDNVIYTDWHRDNFWFAVQRELDGVRGKVGCEFDHMTLDIKAKFDQAAAGKEVVDVGTPMMMRRTIKSDEEIALITEGARICDLGGEAVVAAVAEGVGEHEIALRGTEAMVREIARCFPHAELRDTWIWFQSGINTDGAHNPVTSRKVQKGDILNMNTFPMIAGYYTALERTLFFDHIPSDRHLELWEKNCEVHRRGMKLIKPGVRCCDIAAELNEVYREFDLLKYRSFGYGHSFGILCHYYGREAALELREDIETVLEPNMVVSMEPMITIPEGEPGAGGYREHNILVVTEDGARNITHFPYGPEYNVIKS
ncbi:creatinase-like [Diadema antillarum]|uniref:creatinase-like n=1 Tax=Diadema antillarum TaxID=105358 RepID=UPI003A8B0E93